MDNETKISPYNYWKLRCQAAEAYIGSRSFIPDTSPVQDKAKEDWQMIVKMRVMIQPVEQPPTHEQNY